MSSLRARVTLGLAAVTAALVLVAAVALSSLGRLGGAVDTILRENYRSVIACGEMSEALERQDSAALFAATGNERVAREMLATHREGFERALRVERGNITLPEEGPAVQALARDYADYTAAVDRAMAAPPGAARVDTYFTALLPRFNRVKRDVAAVRAMNQAQMERADRDARAIARRGARITRAAVAAALLLALWLAWRLPGFIVRPVRSFAAAARAIGEGRTDVPVEDPGLRELAPLAEALAAMRDALRAYRESAAGALHDARALSEATMRCLLDPVVVLDDLGGVALSNEAADRAFGLRAGDAAALRGADVTVPEPFLAARDEVLASGQARVPRSLAEAMRWRDRAGERWYLVRAAPLREGAGAPRRVVVVAEDVTRLRRIDALKSDIVATVSHEFKTPLTSLRMATHLLLEPATGPLTEDQRAVITTARDDTERLRALVDEFLDLVRIETEAGAPRRVTVSPAQLLARCVDAHRPIARDKGVALVVEERVPAAPLALDPETLGVALANLVSNAIRHTPPGGAVTLAAEDVGDALRITIRDTGDGVSAEDLARLTDPHRARRVAPGGGRHGLGLSIAQEIVLQHGGALQGHGDVGVGSAFTLTLPRDPRGAERA